jgi:neutral ceramidase
MCTDNWTATDRVKREVLERVGSVMGLDDENFMLMASHAHSASGGYSDYKLYDNQVGGFDSHNFECIVAGIVEAMEQAKASMASVDVFFNVEDITSAKGRHANYVGGQRSLSAYNMNNAKDLYDSTVDHRMWLLKFTQGETVVGMINWYAIHPTSLIRSNNTCHKPSYVCSAVRSAQMQLVVFAGPVR